jgi:hypothetical protein
MSYVSDEYHQPVQDSLNVYLTVHMLVIRVANRLVCSHGSVYTIRGRSRSLSIAYLVRLLNSKDSPCLGDVLRPAVISDLGVETSRSTENALNHNSPTSSDQYELGISSRAE